MTDNSHTNAWSREKKAGSGPFSASRFGYSFAITGDAESRPRLPVRPLGDLTAVDFLNAGAFCRVGGSGSCGSAARPGRRGHDMLLLNLGGVVFSSSSVLGSLALLQRRVGEAGGLLRLAVWTLCFANHFGSAGSIANS